MFDILPKPKIHMKYFAFLTALAISINLHSQNTSLLNEGIPVFHGAKVTGNLPNTEFLFTVPATGERPITFSAENLPKGLSLDQTTGIIRGVVKEKGSYAVKVFATNV